MKVQYLTQEEKNKIIHNIETLKMKEMKNYINEKLMNTHLTPEILGRIFVRIAKPKKGKTRFYTIKELAKIHPDFQSTNGSQWARDDSSWLGRQYIIKRNKNEDGIIGISSVKLNGYNKNETKKYRGISKEIRTALKDEKCVVLDVHSNNEIDHKNARYNDKKNKSAKTQKVSDFQAMTKAVNDAKRQHCKRCRETGIRYDAKNLGYAFSYICGNEKSKTCKGCYWNDPQAFNAAISASFIPKN